MPPTFGRYELLKRLAGGGMGEVYLARQRGLAGFSKLLVIKTLLPHLCEDEEFIHMFQDEARITAQLIHPNICQPFEFDRVDGTYYIAMEYLRGEDVRRLWKAATLSGLTVPTPLICRIISDAASGLDFAHNLKDAHGEPFGIVHRDISPQNILVTFEGGVKLIDFGVAKAQGRLTHTRTGALKGKYSYMSPEQVNGESVDHRTDIFALGIVLYELLTSVRLFKADSDVSTIDRVKRAVIPKPSSVNPSLPPGLDAIVLKALDRDATQRFQSAQEMRLALEDWLMEERKPASSAHLAEFLKRVYKERLELEARHGPMLGEPEPASMPHPGAHRPPSMPNLPRAASAPGQAASDSLPFPFDAPPSPQEPRAPADAHGPDQTRNERTPSQPSRGTNPGSEPSSQKSVIDLSMIQTESSSGPFRGKKGRRVLVAVGSAIAIVGFSIFLLRPREPAPHELLPAQAQLSLATDPPGARVSIDGRQVGTSPHEVSLAAGKSVRIGAQLDGYEPVERVLELAAGPQRVVLPLLRSAAPQVSLLIKSDPENAEVSDGARIVGRTPFNWTATKGEQRTLTFRLAGFRDLQQLVTASGADADLSVRLTRAEQQRPSPQASPPTDADQAIKLER